MQATTKESSMILVIPYNVDDNINGFLDENLALIIPSFSQGFKILTILVVVEAVMRMKNQCQILEAIGKSKKRCSIDS